MVVASVDPSGQNRIVRVASGKRSDDLGEEFLRVVNKDCERTKSARTKKSSASIRSSGNRSSMLVTMLG